jgi:hypothetical protein
MLKAKDAIIAWNYGDVGPDRAPSVAIGPLLGKDGDPDWTYPYECTAGAAWVFRRKLFGIVQQLFVLLDWYQLVYSCGLDPYMVHRAFLEIEEYQAVIKKYGMGPAADEQGHDPNIPYGRCCRSPTPELHIFKKGGAVHVVGSAKRDPIKLTADRPAGDQHQRGPRHARRPSNLRVSHH